MNVLYPNEIDWQPFYNDSNEEIPAFSCIKLTWETKLVNGDRVLKATKPDNYGAQYHHRIAWYQPTDAGQVGYCMLPIRNPALVAFNGGPPQAGQQWGPTDGFGLTQNVGGFRAIASREATPPGVVQVMFEPLLSLTASLAAEMATGAEVDANPFINGAVDAALTLKVKEVLGLGEPLPADTNVRAQWDIDLQTWVAIAAGCGTG